MEISTEQAGNFRPTISKIVMAFAFVSVMGGLCTTPALGRDNDRGRHDARDDRDRRGDRDWHGDRGRYDHRPEYRPAYRHPYYYSQPVYVPPPVYYPPPPSPGISLFFPFDIRIR